MPEQPNLYDDAVRFLHYGKFGKGLKFDRNNSRSRMTIDDGNTVSLGNNWTFSVWAKNLIATNFQFEVDSFSRALHTRRARLRSFSGDSRK